MRTRIQPVVALALLISCAAAAQERELTLEERVVRLEVELQDLADRVALRTTVAPAPGITPDVLLGGRVDNLERAVDRLSVDLQRVERQVDNALREASEARREAMAAERLARDAARLR